MLLVLGLLAVLLNHDETRLENDGEAGAGSSPQASDHGRPPLLKGSSDAVVAEQPIYMRGALRIQVVRAEGATPVADAQIEIAAPVDVDAPFGGTQPQVELVGRLKTDARGVAYADRLPVAREVRVTVRKPGFVTQIEPVPPSSGDREAPLMTVRLRRALGPEEASVKIVVDGVPETLRGGVSVAVRDEITRRTMSIAPGGSVFIDEDPAHSGRRQLMTRLLMPGLAGAWETHMVNRGDTLRLETDVEGQRIEVIALTSQERPVVGARVTLLPAGVSAVLASDSVAISSTDAEGRCRFDVAKGGVGRLTVEHETVFFPESPYTLDLSGGTTAFDVRGHEQHRMRILFEGDPPAVGERVWLQWISFAPLGSGDLPDGSVFPLATRGAAWVSAYANRLSSSLRVESGAGSSFVSLPLLYGQYEVRIGCATSESGLVTLSLEPRMTAPVVRMARAAEYRYRIRLAAVHAWAGVSPQLAMVIGHRASWHERSWLLRQFGPAWRMRKLAADRWANKDGAGTVDRRPHRTLTRMLGEGRFRGAELAPDVAIVDADGLVSLRSVLPPTTLTILFPDGQVGTAIAPETRPDEPATVLIAPPSAATVLRCTVLDEEEHPVPNYRISLSSVEDLGRGNLELNQHVMTDSHGLAELPGLAGDRFLIFALNDKWRVASDTPGVIRRTTELKGGTVVREVRTPAQKAATLTIRLEGPSHQGIVKMTHGAPR